MVGPGGHIVGRTPAAPAAARPVCPWLGILADRWVAFAWMVLLAIGAAQEFREPAVA
jgi:hypothetical protein